MGCVRRKRSMQREGLAHLHIGAEVERGVPLDWRLLNCSEVDSLVKSNSI